jgi:hypothetical protein
MILAQFGQIDSWLRIADLEFILKATLIDTMTFLLALAVIGLDTTPLPT